MKQPLMVVPPAQAEILYDAALEDELRGVRPRTLHASSVSDEWDDRDPAESHDRRVSTRMNAPNKNSH